jgi:undecaprenyl-diphosphatase
VPLLHIAILAIVQGITEFLPISSSGHLVMTWAAFAEVSGVAQPPASQQLALDVSVHVGTLGAVMLYTWRDIWEMLKALPKAARGRSSPGLKLFLLIVVATIPVVIAGFAMKYYLGTNIRSIEVIAWAFIGFGLLLYGVDRTCLTVKQLDHLGFGGAIFIGLAQALALIPGTSRAGITMTAARALGYERVDSARFSMLLSIPTIMAAGVLLGADILKSGNVQFKLDAVISVGISFVTAFIAIIAMMSWLRRATFTPFVIYRVLFGIVLLLWVYGVFGDVVPPPPPVPAG